MEQQVEEDDEMEGQGEDEMEVPEGIEEDVEEGQYEDGNDEENLMIDEHQLAALIEQYER